MRYYLSEIYSNIYFIRNSSDDGKYWIQHRLSNFSNYLDNIILIAIFFISVSCIRNINYRKRSSFLYHTDNFIIDKVRGRERENETRRK